MLLQAAQAYWSYLAAWQTLDAYRETEDRARRLVEETQLLVAADEMPAADLMQLEANLASKTTQRIAAEQLLFQAEQLLGLTMGLPFDQMANLGAPIDPFPQAEEAWLAFLENQEAYLALAHQQRADLSAAQTREQSTRLLLNGARNDLRPRLDLSMNVGYAGAAAGTAFNQFFTPLGTHVGGANVGISLSYTAPFSNRAAEGRALQRASAHQQQITAREDLDRTIRSGVVVALKALERSIYELRASEAAITLYTTAIENERKKLQMSLATLIDVLTVEDRLAQARLSYINAQQRYATALVQLRFETGTLVQVGDASFDLDRLTTLPLSN